MSERAGEIDWKVELRRLEREYDGLPPVPTPARVRAERAVAAQAREREAELGALVATWARVALVITLAVALAWWPYGRGCGVPLHAFLGAVSMVVIGGTWAAARAWRARLAVAHVASVMLVVSGLAILAAEAAPRAGYGTAAWVQGSTWQCGRGTEPGAP